MAYERSDVQRYTVRFQLSEEFPEVEPAAAAVSSNYRRHTLHDKIMSARIVKYSAIGMSMDIDESRRNDVPRCIDDRCAMFFRDNSD